MIFDTKFRERIDKQSNKYINAFIKPNEPITETDVKMAFITGCKWLSVQNELHEYFKKVYKSNE